MLLKIFSWFVRNSLPTNKTRSRFSTPWFGKGIGLQVYGHLVPLQYQVHFVKEGVWMLDAALRKSFFFKEGWVKFIEARHNLKEFGNMTQCNGSVFFPWVKFLFVDLFRAQGTLLWMWWHGMGAMSHVPLVNVEMHGTSCHTAFLYLHQQLAWMP